MPWPLLVGIIPHCLQEPFVPALETLIGASELNLVVIPDIELGFGAGWSAILAQILTTGSQSKVGKGRKGEGYSRGNEIGDEIFRASIIGDPIKGKLPRHGRGLDFGIEIHPALF